MKTVGIHCNHGLGDLVGLTIVLKHLKKYRPDWLVTVEAKPDYLSILRGLCHEARPLPPNYVHTKSHYDEHYYLQFPAPEATYPGLPSTKATKCLLEVFGLDPEEKLCRYTIHPSPEAQDMARGFVTGRKLALIHYQGVSSPMRKNLTHEQAELVVEGAKRKGFTPVLLDFDHNSPLEIERVPASLKDAGTVTALIQEASYFFGIDSGPAHLAAATETPGIVFWHGWWIGHNIEPSDNLEHWYCAESMQAMRGDRKRHLAYFHEHYRTREYGLDLALSLWFKGK
jgi:ADP-heptose:LPS heptosyltransferase